MLFSLAFHPNCSYAHRLPGHHSPNNCSLLDGGSFSSIPTDLFANLDYDSGQGDCVTSFAATPMFAAIYVPVCGVFHGSKALEVQLRSWHLCTFARAFVVSAGGTIVYVPDYSITWWAFLVANSRATSLTYQQQTVSTFLPGPSCLSKYAPFVSNLFIPHNSYIVSDRDITDPHFPQRHDIEKSWTANSTTSCSTPVRFIHLPGLTHSTCSSPSYTAAASWALPRSQHYRLQPWL